MKTVNIPTRSDSNTRISLHQLVEQLIKLAITATINNGNSVVNNVSANFYIQLHEDVIISVIKGMLKSVIANTSDSVIYITARKWYDKMIELNVKDENCYNTYAVALSLQDSVRHAETIQGHLDIMNQKQRITTISFRFPIINSSVD